MKLGERMATLVDPPGIYSLEPTSKVEEVTGQILEQGADVVVNVIDSTNLERNLNLTLQILESRGFCTGIHLFLTGWRTSLLSPGQAFPLPSCSCISPSAW